VLADLAERHGAQRIRTTPHQKLVVLDVAKGSAEALAEGLERLGLRVYPSTFRRNTMACTGIEFCKLAIVETKNRAAMVIEELERRLPSFTQPLTISVNGCPNSCARIQVSDIGLKGMLVTDDRGEQVAGFQVHLGGSLGMDAQLGRKLRGHKIIAADLSDYIERIVRRYESDRAKGETFADWAARAPETSLR
jgi:sulfite reductase (ferredoxin)